MIITIGLQYLTVEGREMGVNLQNYP